VGFFRGFFAPFRGGVFVLRGQYGRYLVLPLILSVTLAVAAMIGAHQYWLKDMGTALADPSFFDSLILGVKTIVFGVLLFLVAQPLLLAVFADRLSERVERDVVGIAPTAPFVSSTGKAITHGLLKLVFYALALAIGAVLWVVIPGLGSLLALCLGGLSLAYDGFDYPLARRNVSFGAKWAYLAKHPGMTIGYGIGATIFYLIPFAIFVAPPMAAVGATLAFIDTEKRQEKGGVAGAKSSDGKSVNVAANS
jgi:uncharacterized protein involved in cysteine biosynthesis